MKKFLIPLALFLGLVVFLAVGLKRDPREIPSPLIDKPAPAFSLPTLDGNQAFGPQDLKGKVWMLNVWATWCVACREEHPVLVAFAQKNAVPIIGLSYKEIQPQDEQGGKLQTTPSSSWRASAAWSGCSAMATPTAPQSWIWMGAWVSITVFMACPKPM